MWVSTPLMVPCRGSRQLLNSVCTLLETVTEDDHKHHNKDNHRTPVITGSDIGNSKINFQHISLSKIISNTILIKK